MTSSDLKFSCFFIYLFFYCVQGRGIQDPTEVIFEMSKEERKDFYRSVALGLNRPLFAVYRRVLRMYDNRNHVGRWVHEEHCSFTVSLSCGFDLLCFSQ